MNLKMALLVGNLASKISFSIQFRVFSIPWAKRNAAILCLKGRDYSTSSVPVSYIPKKSSKVNEPENSLATLKGFEKRVNDQSLDGVGRTFGLDSRTQNGNQMCNESFSFDGAKQVEQNAQNIRQISGLEKEGSLELGVVDDELMEKHKGIAKDMKIQQERDTSIQIMQVGKTMLDAEKLAVELLATRAFTAVELKKKLRGKRFPTDIVEAVITNFQKSGLINDSLYAETFSRSRWSTRSWGPRRIKQALYNKGVSAADAEKAVKLVFEDGESGEQGSKLGLSKLSIDHLLVQASKQWLRGQDVPKETRKSRLIRWLQYRGFNWGIISFVLKKLESQYPP